MKRTGLGSHFTVLIIVSVLCGLIYATVQQVHRAAANDPQIQIATDMRNAIENNHSLSKWMNDDSIDIAKSLSVFKTMFAKNGSPVQSTGLLEQQAPRLPHGVLDFTDVHGENLVTWQPQSGVRVAMVVEAVHSPQIAYVAVGRSLKEVEKRESILTTMVFVAWLVCIGIICLHFLLTYLNQKNQII
jgi:hypothetical protein